MSSRDPEVNMYNNDKREKVNRILAKNTKKT